MLASTRMPYRSTSFRNLRRSGTALTGSTLFTSIIILVGCASPGPPLPPSLKLPSPVTTLVATRIGDHVDLHWITPTRTTDNKPIAGQVTAEICRDIYFDPRSAPPPPKVVEATKPQTPATKAPTAPCTPLSHIAVQAGSSIAADPLPAALLSGPPGLIGYRIQLRNADGRTAGPSVPVFAGSGAVPDPIASLRVTSTKAGALLEWSANATASATVIELDRKQLEPRPAKSSTTAEDKPAKARLSPAKGSTKGSTSLAKPAASAVPAEIHLRVGETAQPAPDPGGTVDRTVDLGGSYSYVAQRVRTVTVGAYTVEMRSAPSALVTVAMLDVFPPSAPAELIAVPGYLDIAAQSGPQHPSIDLSWQPNTDARLAGYRVYRQQLATPARATSSQGWIRLNEQPLTAPGFRDLTVASGRSYAYRVTAVDLSGNESTPSTPATETAP
jgi:hypothetical protein